MMRQKMTMDSTSPILPHGAERTRAHVMHYVCLNYRFSSHYRTTITHANPFFSLKRKSPSR